MSARRARPAAETHLVYPVFPTLLATATRFSAG